MVYLDPASFVMQDVAVALSVPPGAGIWVRARRLGTLWAIARFGAADLKVVAERVG